MIKNIVFDIGFVIMRFDFDDFVKKYFDDKTCEELNRHMWGSDLWHELDLGIRDSAEICEDFVRRAGEYADAMSFAMQHFGECMSAETWINPTIKELHKRGYRVYFLSNWSDYLIEQGGSEMDFIKQMDGGIFSYEVKMAKPDIEIYETLCEKYSLIADECLFIDDSPKNIEGARAAGINGKLFEGYDDLKPVLDALPEVSA